MHNSCIINPILCWRTNLPLGDKCYGSHMALWSHGPIAGALLHCMAARGWRLLLGLSVAAIPRFFGGIFATGSANLGNKPRWVFHTICQTNPKEGLDWWCFPGFPVCLMSYDITVTLPYSPGNAQLRNAGFCVGRCWQQQDLSLRKVKWRSRQRTPEGGAIHGQSPIGTINFRDHHERFAAMAFGGRW